MTSYLNVIGLHYKNIGFFKTLEKSSKSLQKEKYFEGLDDPWWPSKQTLSKRNFDGLHDSWNKNFDCLHRAGPSVLKA